jgi:hypothetical protein
MLRSKKFQYSMVGPAGHTQVNDFNSLQKGGDQKPALKPLSFLTRSYDHLQVVGHSSSLVAPFTFVTGSQTRSGGR